MVHYIDDFLITGAPGSVECAQNMSIMEQTCRAAGLPIEPSKSVGPTTTLTFLGIELDTVNQELRFPADKLQSLNWTLRNWRAKKSCTKRDLLSLIELLTHARKAVRAGRSFLR